MVCCFRGEMMQTAEIKWIGKQQFVGMSPSGHAMVMDGDRATNVGPSPMEMLLMALDVMAGFRNKASCSPCGGCMLDGTMPP